MFTQLGAAMVGLADSIMVGHYSTADLAAVSFSNAIFFTVMVFAMGALMGVTPLVGHVHGRLEKLLQQGTTEEEINHKHEQITSYLVNGLVFTAIMYSLSGRFRSGTRGYRVCAPVLYFNSAVDHPVLALLFLQAISGGTRQYDGRDGNYLGMQSAEYIAELGLYLRPLGV